MENKKTQPLILGGHSFIAQLGIEDKISFEESLKLVSTCLDSGIRGFDTTYQPERVALGKVLKTLGRRCEAEIIAWNFFEDFDDNGDLGGARMYRDGDIETMLSQLQCDFIDILILHGTGNAENDHAQYELAKKWRAQKLVGKFGLWAPTPDFLSDGSNSEYLADFSVIVQPGNIFQTGAEAIFAAASTKELENLSCSPFVRGYKLQAMANAAQKMLELDSSAAMDKCAELLCRYCLFRPHADRMIIAMRSTKLVKTNIDYISKGPLTADELRLLEKLAANTQ